MGGGRWEVEGGRGGRWWKEKIQSEQSKEEKRRGKVW